MARKDESVGRGWSQSGELLTGSSLVRGSSKAVNLQAKLQEDDSLTVQFNVEKKSDFVANPQAEIVSSVEGNTVRRVVTVIDGASITTRGRNIRVIARDFTDASFGPGRKYVVSILATLGVRAGSKQPPILIPLTYFDMLGVESPIGAAISLATGQNNTIVIPPDAGVTMVHTAVWVDTGAAGPVPEQSLFVSHENSSTVMKYYDPLTFSDWVPIAPNSSIIRISNNSTFPSYWQVTFGVDG